MYKSKEIRWFSKLPEIEILTWFQGQKLSFDQVEPRTDYYLPLPGNDAMGVKLREGNIEIKHRISAPTPGNLGDNAIGMFENWVKWSFQTSGNDPLSRSIIRENKYQWTAVFKQRMGIKLTREPNGATRLLNFNEMVPAGCLVEYTRVVAQQVEWYTFGLEWFGDNFIEPEQSIIDDILGDGLLSLEDSMGYPEFLNKVNTDFGMA